MSKKLAKDFITKAIQIHGDRYNYSLVDYKTAKTSIKIICRKHGIFEMQPQKHLIDQNCQECWKERRKGIKKSNVRDFIRRARKKHNNLYDYTESIYLGIDNKIKIICEKHGVFLQTPKHHLSGHGCAKCGFETTAKKRTKLKETFINKAKVIYPEYDYSEIKYTNATKPIHNIICKEHGKFSVYNKYKHFNGDKCPRCSGSLGERKIMQLFADLKLPYESQKKFKYCKDKQLLRFDFYIPSKNIVIEYNGRQHYEMIPFFGGVKGFKERQKRDSIKRKYCAEVGLVMIEIPYTAINNIKERLSFLLEEVA